MHAFLLIFQNVKKYIILFDDHNTFNDDFENFVNSSFRNLMVKGTNDMRTNSNVHVQIFKMKFKEPFKKWDDYTNAVGVTV